jgi:hypothetical protein
LSDRASAHDLIAEVYEWIVEFLLRGQSRPVTVILRPGKTPSGVEVRAHLRRLVRHIRTRWQKTRITFSGDGHNARPEAMTWCENNCIDYMFGLSGTKPLAK